MLSAEKQRGILIVSFWYSYFWSSVGKKIITAITGLGLYLYLILHLAGNLTLFARCISYQQIRDILDKVKNRTH